MQFRPKKIFKAFLVILLLVFVLFKGLEWWIEYRFEARINRAPDRAYDITYKDLDLHSFFKGLTLKELSIVPVAIDSGTVIVGEVSYARLNGMVWYDLVIGKKLNIDGIVFVEPKFEITLSADTVKSTSGKGMQMLFSDIISRAKLKRFGIESGSIVVLERDGESVRGKMDNLNLKANEIRTDSVIWSHLIPFELGSFEASIDSISFQMNDYTHLSSGRLEYTTANSTLTMNDLDMSFTEDWREVSKAGGKQTDLMEVGLGALTIENLAATSSFYSSLDIVARKIRLEDVVFKDLRDKNMPRPPDEIKPMFKGMVDAVPLDVKVDSVEIVNARVQYAEVPKGKDTPGILTFEDINGVITRFTTFPEEQLIYESFEANIRADLGGVASVDMTLEVPYDRESFHMTSEVAGFAFEDLNETSRSMAGVEFSSGESKRIYFEMKASEFSSQNTLVFDYKDLELEVIKKSEDHESKDDAFLSALANTGIRDNNLPDQEKYLSARYVTERDRNRGPFNFMWKSLSSGMMHIVPGKFVQKLLGVDKKSKKKKKN